MSIHSPLTAKQRQYLKRVGHHLHSLIRVGKGGISEPLVSAVTEALLQHELVKVRVGGSAPGERHQIATELAQRTGACLAGVLGMTALIYKAHPENPTIKFPKTQ